MRLLAFTVATVLVAGTAHAQSQPNGASGGAQASPPQSEARPSGHLQQKLAPGLAGYTDEVLFGEVWPGAGLSPRDRSLVVISALIATNKPAQLQGHLGRALTNGVTPVEASGVLTHVALYAGWPSAVSALEVYDRVYTDRGVDFDALQAAASASALATAGPSVDRSAANRLSVVAPRFADLTNRVIVDDLWQRPDLTIRDRHLVTIAVHAALGEADLLEPHMRGGVEAGLTREEIAEALTHLGFYVGWGKATLALDEVGRTLGVEASR